MDIKRKLIRQSKKSSGNYLEVSEQENTYDSNTNVKLEKAVFN